MLFDIQTSPFAVTSHFPFFTQIYDLDDAIFSTTDYLY